MKTKKIAAATLVGGLLFVQTAGGVFAAEVGNNYGSKGYGVNKEYRVGARQRLGLNMREMFGEDFKLRNATQEQLDQIEEALIKQLGEEKAAEVYERILLKKEVLVKIHETLGEDFDFKTATEEEKEVIKEIMTEHYGEDYKGMNFGRKNNKGNKYGQGKQNRLNMKEMFGEDFRLRNATDEQLLEIKEALVEKLGEEKAEEVYARITLKIEALNEIHEALGEDFDFKTATEEEKEIVKEIMTEYFGEDGAGLKFGKRMQKAAKHTQRQENKGTVQAYITENYGEDVTMRDLTEEQRQEVIEYMKETYGKNILKRGRGQNRGQGRR